ncbi:zinc-dependent metalloprotease [Pedobacter sp. P351]|uniref:zinc-dependent metalloprotease n=1 Tax=Pedobacter superstes TaxID=3133441 RepID=UPI0030A63B94
MMKLYSKILIGLLALSKLSYAQTIPAGQGSQSRSESRQAASISSYTQGFKKFEGYFDFYYDEKSGKVFLEIDKLGKEFLYFSSLSTGVGNGGPERGQASSALAKFVKEGTKVLLVEPVTTFRAITSNIDEIKAVESNFANSVIFGFVPVAIEGGKVLVDITSFIIRDTQGVGSRLGVSQVSGQRGAGVPAGPAYRLDETRSVVYMPNTKNFPKNTEFEAMVTFIGGGGGGGRRGFGGVGIAPDPSAITINLHQSFVELPEDGFKMRKFDPRTASGQFNYMDFSAPITESMVKRTIRRHRLEKKNPGAELSEAVKPIVYYISRGVPEPVKKALIDGGAWWNQAFEAAGFKNAFQVKELPEGADPMDIRYNVVNWITRSGSPARAFSSGASYIDPRTGEIIKGVVTLGSDRHRQDYLIAVGLLQPYIDGKPVTKAMEEMALKRVRQLSAHEIGHTLGFSHNFAASHKDRASVMDYPYPKFSLKADGTVDISDSYADGIGSWDKRSVMWAYTEFKKGANEDAELDKIMNETLKLGFEYIPDIGGNAHPSSNQWEDGKDPIEQMTNIMKVRRKVLDEFSEKSIPQGMPMATMEEVLVPIYLLHRYQVEAVAKSVGGLYFTHAVKNDGQVPTRMVAPAQQWKAFESLMSTISPEALALPDALISKIPPRPSGFPASVETFTGYTGPTFDPIAAAETAASTTISYLLNSERAARLIEYSSRDSGQPGFMPIVDKLFERTWKAPMPAGYKGELQTTVNNQVVKYLLQLAANSSASEIVRGQALLKIDELKLWMASSMAGAKPAQKANMMFALSQIEAFRAEPNKFEAPAALDMPPGAPIGMPAMDFLNDNEVY